MSESEPAEEHEAAQADAEAIRRVAAVIAARLAAVGARDESLAEYRAPRRLLGVLPRPAAIVPTGRRVWRLGEYLLAPDGELRRTGRVVRVAGTDRRRSVVAESITERHQLAVAARRGGHREGDTANFDTVAVDLAGLDAATIAAYLEERAELLIHPPGAD